MPRIGFVRSFIVCPSSFDLIKSNQTGLLPECRQQSPYKREHLSNLYETNVLSKVTSFLKMPTLLVKVTSRSFLVSVKEHDIFAENSHQL